VSDPASNVSETTLRLPSPRLITCARGPGGRGGTVGVGVSVGRGVGVFVGVEVAVLVAVDVGVIVAVGVAVGFLSPPTMPHEVRNAKKSRKSAGERRRMSLDHRRPWVSWQS
jgi:hypothetical protein